MKKLFLVFCFSILFFAANSQWVWQNRLPQGNPLAAVRFADATTVYAVGGGYLNGTILKSTDAGATWNIILSGVSDGLSSIFFTDVNT